MHQLESQVYVAVQGLLDVDHVGVAVGGAGARLAHVQGLTQGASLVHHDRHGQAGGGGLQTVLGDVEVVGSLAVGVYRGGIHTAQTIDEVIHVETLGVGVGAPVAGLTTCHHSREQMVIGVSLNTVARDHQSVGVALVDDGATPGVELAELVGGVGHLAGGAADVHLQVHLVVDLPHENGIPILVAVHVGLDVGLLEGTGLALGVGDEVELILAHRHVAEALHVLTGGHDATAQREGGNHLDAVLVAKVVQLVQACPILLTLHGIVDHLVGLHVGEEADGGKAVVGKLLQGTFGVGPLILSDVEVTEVIGEVVDQNLCGEVELVEADLVVGLAVHVEAAVDVTKNAVGLALAHGEDHHILGLVPPHLAVQERGNILNVDVFDAVPLDHVAVVTALDLQGELILNGLKG